VAELRWIADEMVGRLARYLRFVGYDTEYARGATDDEIAARARAEGRVVLTRDRLLARRSPGAILLTSTGIEGQWREMRASVPDLATEPRFARCTECNGPLAPDSGARRGPGDDRMPPEVRSGGQPRFRCARCGHLYWEGTHSRAVRERLARWSAPPGAIADDHRVR
jgi:uncharacterized protein